MKLRNLQLKDAPFMLEWMQDDRVVHDLDKDFAVLTQIDCENFIKNSKTDKDIHMAIVNDADDYMGTVSLKNIDQKRKIAEFGISIRSMAMGKGYSSFAMEEILKIAKEKGIRSVFWYVSSNNKRALRFYDKNGYKRVNSSMIYVNDECSEKERERYIWYLTVT